MKEKIDKEFSSKVDFSQEKDLFHGYIHTVDVWILRYFLSKF